MRKSCLSPSRAGKCQWVKASLRVSSCLLRFAGTPLPQACADEIASLAQSLGGTCSGEHGVG